MDFHPDPKIIRSINVGANGYSPCFMPNHSQRNQGRISIRPNIKAPNGFYTIQNPHPPDKPIGHAIGWDVLAKIQNNAE